MHLKNIHHKNVKVKKSLYRISRLVQCFPLSSKHDHLNPQRSRVHSLLKDRDSLSCYKKKSVEKVSSISYFNVTTYFQNSTRSSKVKTAILAIAFLKAKQTTDNMIDLNSPQHTRLLGFNNVEEHEDGMEQVISALWEWEKKTSISHKNRRVNSLQLWLETICSPWASCRRVPGRRADNEEGLCYFDECRTGSHWTCL